jgi:hypothetical protein
MNRTRPYSSLIDHRDIAHWITLHLAHGGKAPTRQQLQERYGMSLATAYRWLSWARSKQQQMNSGR